MDYSFKTHLVPKTFGTQSSYTRQTTIRQQADDERTPTIQEIDNKRVRSRPRTDEERIRNRQGTDEALFTKWAPRKTWLHPPQKHSAAITSGANRRRNFGRVAWSNQGVRENFRSIYLILTHKASTCLSVCLTLIFFENKSWWKKFLFCFSFRLASIMGPKKIFLDSVTRPSNGEGQVVCQVRPFWPPPKKISVR